MNGENNMAENIVDILSEENDMYEKFRDEIEELEKPMSFLQQREKMEHPELYCTQKVRLIRYRLVDDKVEKLPVYYYKDSEFITTESCVLKRVFNEKNNEPIGLVDETRINKFSKTIGTMYFTKPNDKDVMGHYKFLLTKIIDLREKKLRKDKKKLESLWLDNKHFVSDKVVRLQKK